MRLAHFLAAAESTQGEVVSDQYSVDPFWGQDPLAKASLRLTPKKELLI
jgi:hypothetical protein